MVRSVLLTHGLNHHRATMLANNDLFENMILSLPAVSVGETEIQILYCQDGFPESWRETAEKRENNPGASTDAYWTALVKRIDPMLTVRLIDFSFTNRFHENRETRLALLKTSDIFYCRGAGNHREMGIKTFDALVNISDNRDYDKEVLTLQYEVMQNRLVYIGVCGAAKWAGYVVEMPDGSFRRGLGLFGRDVFVEYSDWNDKTKESSQVIEINEINYGIVDTCLAAIRSGLMMGKNANRDRKDEYRAKAHGIQQNLNGVLEYLLRKVDVYTCTATGQLFELRIGDGMARYRPC